MQWESILTNATVHRTVAPGFDTLAGVRSPELVSIPAAGSAARFDSRRRFCRQMTAAPSGALQAFCRRQNLGAGGIHFRRAFLIPSGVERPEGAEPKNKSTAEAAVT